MFEFGCGQGKNLKRIKPFVDVVHGIDVSVPAILIAKQFIPFAEVGDENTLKYVGQYDVAFTCSVLDHIPEIGGIIEELKRIAPAVILLETNSVQGRYYYPHDYESYGFTKLDYSWKSTGDGALYEIWVSSHVPINP